MGWISRAATWLAVAVAAAGCFNLDLEGFSNGPSDAGSAADADAASFAGPVADANVDSAQSPPSCKGEAGPVSVPLPGTRQCIDATEVSAKHYAEFLAARGSDTSGQPAVCAWNTSFVPSSDWPPGADAGALPVANVDWCDAYAYCAWAGKHLCGHVDGGSLDPVQAGNPTVDLWYYACSHGGDNQHSFPYGGSYASLACRGGENQPDASAPTTVPVGSMTSCAGGYPGVFDMSGNLAEWEDSCTSTSTPASDLCFLRGGGFLAPQAVLGCGSLNDRGARTDHWKWAGIRCCSDR